MVINTSAKLIFRITVVSSIFERNRARKILTSPSPTSNTGFLNCRVLSHLKNNMLKKNPRGELPKLPLAPQQDTDSDQRVGSRVSCDCLAEMTAAYHQ